MLCSTFYVFSGIIVVVVVVVATIIITIIYTIIIITFFNVMVRLGKCCREDIHQHESTIFKSTFQNMSRCLRQDWIKKH